MGLHGLFADHELAGDGAVGEPCHEVAQDLALALREAEMRAGPELAGGQPRGRGDRTSCHARVDDGLAGSGTLDLAHQLLTVDRLEQVAGCTGTQRLEEVLLVVVRAQQHDPSRRVSFHQPPAEIEAAGGSTKPHIRHHDVRIEGGHQFLGIFGAHSLGDNADPAAESGKEGFEPFEHHFVVVYQDDAQRRIGSRPSRGRPHETRA